MLQFDSYVWEPDSCAVTLKYTVDQRRFEEQIVFAGATPLQDDETLQALHRSLHLLHLMCGVSYFKLSTCQRVQIGYQELSARTGHFFEDLYIHGLAEFAFKNNISLGSLKFDSSPQKMDKPAVLSLPNRIAIPIGGGKDAIVTRECLRDRPEPVVAWALINHQSDSDFAEPQRAITAVAETAGLPLLTVHRRLPRELFQLIRQGAPNGHPPTSAILSFLLLTSSILQGFNTCVVSNERSANSGNLTYQGIEVNHQYSKSLRYEQLFREFVNHHFDGGLNYFSLLRPLSELSIARIFCRYTQYHRHFLSCNKYFRIEEDRRSPGWCCDCPKCRFVYLAMAAFLSPIQVIKIFGENLLDSYQQMDGFLELVGLKGHRPFECVGEYDESRAAFLLICDKPEWADGCVVRFIAPQIKNMTSDRSELMQRVFALDKNHCLPHDFSTRLDQFVNSTSWPAIEERG